MVDFNAKMGKKEVDGCTIGRHSKHDKTSKNGLKLVSFAAGKSCTIFSAYFKRKYLQK